MRPTIIVRGSDRFSFIARSKADNFSVVLIALDLSLSKADNFNVVPTALDLSPYLRLIILMWL